MKNIPELQENQELKKEKLESKQSFTEPPPRYTEASLVKSIRRKRNRQTKYVFSNNYNNLSKKIYRKRYKNNYIQQNLER